VSFESPRGSVPALLSLSALPGSDPPALCMVVTDITDRKRAEEKLRGSREQLRSFSGRLQSMLEEERTRISREIHDELGQSLTALNWTSRLYEEKSSPRDLPSSPRSTRGRAGCKRHHPDGAEDRDRP